MLRFLCFFFESDSVLRSSTAITVTYFWRLAAISNQSSVRRQDMFVRLLMGYGKSLCCQTHPFAIGFKSNCAVIVSSLAHCRSPHKGTILKLTTVQFMNWLGLENKHPVCHPSLEFSYSMIIICDPWEWDLVLSVMLLSPTWKALPGEWVDTSADQLIQRVVWESGRSFSGTCIRSDPGGPFVFVFYFT